MSRDSVFAAFDELPARSFTEAAYQTLMLLSHRDWLAQTTMDQLLQRASVPGDAFASPEWRQRVHGVIERIERLEGKPLAELADAELCKYSEELNELLFRKLHSSYSITDAAGKAMLKELQKDPTPAKRGSRGRQAGGVKRIKASVVRDIVKLGSVSV